MKIHVLYLRIAAALAGGLFLSQVAITVFFPAKSPVLRTDLSPYLEEQTGTLLSQLTKLVPHIDIGSLISLPQRGPATTTLPENGYLVKGESPVAASVKQSLARQIPRAVSPGIYTSGNTASFLTTVKQNEVKWTVVSYVVNGKPVQIRIPAGQTAPPAQLLNTIY